MQGLIFSIKRYSIHDGPGIRVTFFLKGCPLSCQWCHNPEGISPLPETVVSNNRISGLEFCRMEEIGKYYSVDEITEIVEREKVFINQSKGGVTFSGGEPMLQHEFLLEALKRCKNMGYHTVVDTSGYSQPENFEAVIPYTDLFLFDIKNLEDTRHIQSTGVSNAVIIENFHLLLDNAKEVILRIPVIPGFNDDREHIESLKQFILSTKKGSLKMINLLPFHRIGSAKYKKLDRQNTMPDIDIPSKKEMFELKEYFLSAGLDVKIGG
jgi:pyruvate formate lyase activating enzyme